MNKSITFRYMDKGKIKFINSLYGGTKLDIVPVFYSNDIESLAIIRVNNDIAVIINKEYEDKINKPLIMDIKISYLLLQHTVDRVELIDTLNAYWFGFQTTIDVILAMENIDEIQKRFRIKQLENLLLSAKDIEVPSKESLLGGFRYMRVY